MNPEPEIPPKPKSNPWLLRAALALFLIVLVVIFYPVYLSSRPAAKRSACISNLKQLGMAMVLYLDEHDDHACLNNWTDALYPYVKNWRLYTCPSVQPKDAVAGAKPTVSGYAMNYRLVGAAMRTVNKDCALLFETDALSPDVVASVNARNGRHDGKSSVLFTDTSARLVPIAEVVRDEP